MSKKHYIPIARSLYLLRQRLMQPDYTIPPCALFDEIVSDLAAVFKADNTRFDCDRFFTAIYKDKE